MERHLAALLPLLLLGALLSALVGIPIFVAVRQRRRDRRRILAQGNAADAAVTRIVPYGSAGRCRVYFSYQPEIAGAQRECRQDSTLEAVKALQLENGASLRVQFPPRYPQHAFSAALTTAERLAALPPPPGAEASPPAVYFIAFVAQQGARRTSKTFGWSGDGDITLAGEVVRFTAQRMRPFWFPKLIEQEFPRSAFGNVEVFGDAVRCEITSQSQTRTLQFTAVNAEEARAIGARLPDTRTADFAPQLAERAEFTARLREVSPHAPVTPVLIAINVAMFLVAVALGGGILVPKGDVLIRLGSDYTPLTAAGQWWRLLTCTFLHFGLGHLAFNMWALWVNGVLAERLYGSSRFLTLYLFAGVAGSVASFLWHPYVNGAGASGAIFGVLGALLAYFLRSDSGIPPSVLKTQRNAAAIFIVYSILNGARFRGIDNAAHLGGLAAGFVVGWLLCRPLDAKRNEQDWTVQWVNALAVIVGSVLIGGYYLANGQWRPRVLHDASGRQITFAELAPPPRTFAGVTLGMTLTQLEAAKGKPLQMDSYHWTYNSIDSAHDGLVDVFIRSDADGRAAVWAIVFWGKPEAEPPGMANLLEFSSADLTMRYGAPRFANAGGDARYLYFSNGIIAWMADDKVRGYGVYEQAH
ncbi:MAG: rhomboid family intramembrane serine protease [Gammaproteobacteria bacterium]|nr:rhomboid family intramembrane serine protease [Gammaproteobacteria bacterium]